MGLGLRVRGLGFHSKLAPLSTTRKKVGMLSAIDSRPAQLRCGKRCVPFLVLAC